MMEYDEKCKLDPTMPLKYPCTRSSTHLAILVIINLCPVMMSQSGDITKIIIPLRYSDWIANLVPVRNKNGEIRLCVDFINLNKCSRKDNYPLPKMEHILQKVSGSSVMSFIDGFSRYNQIVVHLDDREKTAFTTPWGTFMYENMPFGLMNDGASF
jgi:hypothetical protein